MKYEEMTFNSYYELTKLPWFEMRGRLRLRHDADVPPILDAHTHLGWSYFGGRVIEYQKLYDREAPQYYDYAENPVDLNQDEHPLKSEADAITVDIALILTRCPPKAKYQTAANLLEEMDRFNTRASVVLPIEIPFRSRHAYQVVTACKPHERLIAFCGVHPWTGYKKLRMDWQVGEGAIGLKYHPEFQFCPPDSKGAMELFEMCAARGLPILAHSGSTGTEPGWMQQLSHPDRYRAAAAAFPELKIVLAHSSIKYFRSAINMAKKYPNIYLETSGQGVPALREIFKNADEDRIMYGSDWTFFPLGVPIARSMVALQKSSDEFKEKYFYKNAVNLLGLDEDAFLDGHIRKA